MTEIAREGARQMLMAALKAEAASFVAQFSEELLPEALVREYTLGCATPHLRLPWLFDDAVLRVR